MIIDTNKLREALELSIGMKAKRVDEETINDRIAMARLTALETEYLNKARLIVDIESMALQYKWEEEKV